MIEIHKKLLKLTWSENKTFSLDNKVPVKHCKRPACYFSCRLVFSKQSRYSADNITMKLPVFI